MIAQKDFQEFLLEAQTIYLEDIREGCPQAFTRIRKTTPFKLMLQMFSQKGTSQFSELLDFNSSHEKPLDISIVAFYKARMKYNPNAIHLMMSDYLSMIYENHDTSLAKLNGFIITAIERSDIILPTTEENTRKYGTPNPKHPVSPVMAKISLLYDCVNKLVLDTCIVPYKYSERECAFQHIEQMKTILRQPTITTFDHRYFSMRLVDQLIENKQKFVMRMDNRNFKRYFDKIVSGEDRSIAVALNRKESNDYRKDHAFRMKLMNTTYTLRFAKIPLVKASTGEVYDELLLTNLTTEEFSLERLKELYRLRGEIETAYNIFKNRMK